jgi:chromosome segregation ATPase
VEEARRSVKELNEEIMFEKETTKNLNLQLRKMQDANMELVLEIEDLEKALEQQREENGIKKTHESPEASFHASSGDDNTPVATVSERKWHERLAEKEDENKDLQAKIASLELLLSQRHPKVAFTPKETDDAFVQSLQGMVKVLQQDVEELEAESNGLTDEIRVLKSRLEISNQELSEKNARIIELETNATSPLPQTSGSTPAQLQQKRFVFIFSVKPFEPFLVNVLLVRCFAWCYL